MHRSFIRLEILRLSRIGTGKQKNGPWFYINKTGKKVLYRDTVCGMNVTKNIDGDVVWPKKTSKEICAEAESSRRQEEKSTSRACDRLYPGKPVKVGVQSRLGDELFYQAVIVGVSPRNGVASAKVTESGSYYGQIAERSCESY